MSLTSLDFSKSCLPFLFRNGSGAESLFCIFLLIWPCAPSGIAGNTFSGSFPTEFSRLTNLKVLLLGMLFIVFYGTQK
jgi:hypothetical protein